MVQSESVAGVGKCDAGAAPCCPERKKNPEVRVRQEGRAESDEEGARVGVSFFSHTLTSNNRLRVTDAPGFYAAFPWGVTLGKRGRPERAATPLANALYIPLSLPRIFLHLAVYSATVATDREVHRGPPPGASGEGGSSLHGPISAMHRTQRAPFDEKHAHQRRP